MEPENIEGIKNNVLPPHITNQKKQNAFLKHTKIFTEYLKKNFILFEHFNELEDYEQYLLTVRDKYGFLKQPWWYGQHIESLRSFYRLKGIEDNPFQKEKKDQLIKRYSKALECILQAKRKEHLSRKSMDDICEVFFERMIEKIPKEAVNRYHWVIDEIKNYLKKKGKLILSFNSKDENELLRIVCGAEKVSSKKLKEKALKNHIRVFRHFFQWLYEEGYVYKRFYTENNLVKKEMENNLKAVEMKKRYYSEKELEVAYKRHLEMNYCVFTDAVEHFRDWKMFLKFVKGKEKTLYTVDIETVEAFKKWLGKIEYAEGRKYKPFARALKLYRIQRFYDWFTFNGYTRNHPLKDFKMYQYKRALEATYQMEQRLNLDDKVPEEFKKIYFEVASFEKSTGLAKSTLESHKRGWRIFFDYLKTSRITDMNLITENHIKDYGVYLESARNTNGKELSNHARFVRLTAIKRLFDYLYRFKYIDRNPCSEVRLPKYEKGLPSTEGMTDSEASKIISTYDTTGPSGIRNRAILELLYSTGMRSNELRNLRVKDLDLEDGYVRINVPKGGEAFQRVVPMGQTACQWILSYLNDARDPFTSNDYLFVGRLGLPLTKATILNIVKGAKAKNNIKKNIVTHSFRVACATEMLKGKAGIKFVQAQLGHRSINSTEKYIRLVPDDLKAVHSRCHPRERGKIRTV